ncbi:glycosyltransferase [Gluconobacter cerevisiae]|uniref:Glycosyltransferase n=1 Tax=Gluconobacter cerevisiae TaxID=1379734 RepID=A0ABR9YHF0_9PROT|nr:glycosyltransferase [Gluconobacter cerevisiae]MBF0877938.1 glycosyltransferase [Gluconobacter cerevisiae]
MRDNARDTLIESYRSAARLNGLKAEQLQKENQQLLRQLSLIQTSLSWRVTLPLRAVRALMLGKLLSGRPVRDVPGRFVRLWARDGWAGLQKTVVHRLRRLKRVRAKLRTGLPEAADETGQLHPYKAAHQSDGMRPKVLIIAELSLRQCAKYRVWQKRDFLTMLGWSVQVVDWRDIADAMSALQLCTQVIFYRVPGFEDVLKLVQEAHRLELAPRWEVDDLIFDEEEYRQNGNIKTLPAAERDLVLSGVVLFRRCMLACGRGIASTEALEEAMRKAGLSDVVVLENALDMETLKVAAALPLHSGSELLWVSYGSGTNTHDADFRQAEAGLLAAMAEEPRLCLRVIGQLQLSAAFERFGDRVERLTELSYPEYLRALSQTDIAIAPLEPTLFNDCKSNIKFLEAAIVRVAAICSPRAAFLTVMRDGLNGCLAADAEEWRNAFLRLARDDNYRKRLAEAAYENVMARYAPESMVQTQARLLFGVPAVQEAQNLRVLMANVYFAPRSFGGATIVAEEMGRRLVRKGAKVSVLTSRSSVADLPDGDIRYDVDGMTVFASVLPDDQGGLGQLDNPAMAARFSEILEACQPDVVHVHAAQGLGTGLLRVCQEKGVPYVLTLHDAWWLCERQFMVRADGRYCFQTTIDQAVCQACVPGARHLTDRAVVMRQALNGAALLISPSQAHRELYLANGVAPERIVVNRNGFRWPERPRRKRTAGTPLRFGFVGGTEAVKGYGLLKEAMQSLSRSDWELVLVDNKLNLGFQSIFPEDWSVRGRLRVVPAYTQSGLDDFYDQIDVLLFPSQWKESYGLTVREALARDVWVVTTAPGGQSEDVVDGLNGTCLPLDGKSRTLAEAVLALLDAPERFENYVNPFRERLATYDTQADELYAFLQQAAGLTA